MELRLGSIAQARRPTARWLAGLAWRTHRAHRATHRDHSPEPSPIQSQRFSFPLATTLFTTPNYLIACIARFFIDKSAPLLLAQTSFQAKRPRHGRTLFGVGNLTRCDCFLVRASEFYLDKVNSLTRICHRVRASKRKRCE